MNPNCTKIFIDWIASDSAQLIVILCITCCNNMIVTLIDPILPDLIWRADGMPPVDESSSHQYTSNTINQNGRLGFLGAANPLTQCVCSPLASFIVNRSNPRHILLMGNFGIFICIAAFIDISRTYAHDDERRSRNLGMLLFSYSMGTIVGPLFGSSSYHFIGKAAPFAMILGVISVCIVFQTAKKIFGDRKTENIQPSKPSNAWKIVTDPVILCVLAQFFVMEMNFFAILTFAPLRLIELSEIDSWKFGMVVVPLVICSAVSLIVAPFTVTFSPRWLTAFVAVTISGVTLTLASVADGFLTLMLILSLQGIAQGSLRMSLHPYLPMLAELRHNSDFTSIYGWYFMICFLGISIGGLLGGVIAYRFGTTRLFALLAVCTFVVSYFCFAFRNQKQISTHDQEKMAILPNADCRDP